MSKILEQFLAIWKKLGVNQKATILLMLVASVAGVAVLARVSAQPAYEMLYADLDERDMAQVVSYLKEAKVPYRLTNGGRTIMVAEGRKYDARLGLAGSGVQLGTREGLEIISGNGWAPSAMVEQMMKRRAIQGELARTIMHIEQVEWADVQIAQPESSPFAEEQKAVTAAITLRTRSASPLRPSQVAGIARLVAGSVEGLSPENVTIVDAATGALLSSPRADTTGAEAADRHAFRQAYEDYLAAKAQVILDRALGTGRSVVKVTAVLDMDSVKETVEKFDPEGRVARMEKTISETTAGEAGGAGSSKEESETSYEVPKVLLSKQTAPGALKHLAVSVILDPTFKDAEGKDARLPEEEVNKLKDLVKTAVGVMDAPPRNDSIVVHAVPFRKSDPAAPPDALPDPARRERYMEMIKYGSSVAAAVIFAVFALLAFKRTAREAAPVPAGGAGSPDAAAFMSFTQGVGGNGNGEAKNRVKDLIASNPLTAARLLQRWISEDNQPPKG